MNFLNQTHFPTLETERLILREFKLSDFSKFFEVFSNPQVYQYFGFEPTNKDECLKWLHSFIDRFYENRGIRWAILLKENQEYIGNFGIHTIRIEEKCVERGLHLSPSYWKKGFGAEASNAGMDWIKKNSNFEFIDTWTAVENKASQALLKKQGFEVTGEEMFSHNIKTIRLKLKI